jgi:hypothetical protein
MASHKAMAAARPAAGQKWKSSLRRSFHLLVELMEAAAVSAAKAKAKAREGDGLLLRGVCDDAGVDAHVGAAKEEPMGR